MLSATTEHGEALPLQVGGHSDTAPTSAPITNHEQQTHEDDDGCNSGGGCPISVDADRSFEEVADQPLSQ